MLPALIAAALPLLDKILPDAGQAADAKLKALEMAQRGELAGLDTEMRLALAQVEVNKVEAASANTFANSWRPFAGWCCGMGLAYEFLLRPILPWLVAVAGRQVPPLPGIDVDTLMVLLAGLLGLGGLRSVEKVKGSVR